MTADAKIKVTLEDFTPYDRSVQWQLHDAYFANRGIAAWIQGDVPYWATSNYGIARQHAQLFVELVQELVDSGRAGPDEELWVLEVGSGLGRFAANFFRALESDCGAPGLAVAARLRYLFSDYSARSLGEATTTDLLVPLVQSGRLRPALFDIREPRAITFLPEGKPFSGQLTAVIANYVCCVTAPKLVRKTQAGYLEKYVRLTTEVEPSNAAAPAALLAALLEAPTRENQLQTLGTEIEWRPLVLEELLPDPLHGRLVRALLEGPSEAMVTYPHMFVDCLRALAPTVRPGGLVLVCDYGSPEMADLAGLKERPPTHYGNTLNHQVDFAVFDALCAQAGWNLRRTTSPFRSVHCAAIAFSPELAPRVAEAFERIEVEREDGERLLELGKAARLHAAQNEHAAAARLFRRYLQLDPDDVEALYQMGVSCIESANYPSAAEHLGRGRALDRERRFDFDFQLGRAYFWLGEYARAIERYQASLERDQHPVTYANLGAIHLRLKDYKGAYQALTRALEIDPQHQLAREVYQQLAAEWLSELGAK
jgi:tetratricopeptide (TPR) repeat protein